MVAFFFCFAIGEINTWAPLTHLVNIPHTVMMTPSAPCTRLQPQPTVLRAMKTCRVCVAWKPLAIENRGFRFWRRFITHSSCDPRWANMALHWSDVTHQSLLWSINLQQRLHQLNNFPHWRKRGRLNKGQMRQILSLLTVPLIYLD